MRQSPTFRSFVEDNYRYFFVGSLVTNTGTWMGRTAQAWLVLVELTDHSATALGYVTAMQFLPSLLLAPWAGVIADRFAKRTVLAFTQLSMGLVQLVTGVLVLTGQMTLSLIYVLTLLLGAAAAVDAPARQAFVSEIVGPSLLSNAIGLQSANFNAARLIGPGVAGLLIAVVGTGWVFVLNAVAFLGVIASLKAMRVEDLAVATVARARGQIREGISYVAGRPDIMLIMAIVFLQGTFGMNFQMTTALMATMEFGKGPGEFGLLGSIMAVGSLAAALMVARRPRPRLRTIVVSLLAFAVCTAAAAMAPTYEVFAVLLVPVGMAALTILPTANSVVQMAVDPEMRGRVMSLYVAIFLGGTPVGSPFIGWVGQNWGARWTLWIGAASALVAAVGTLAYLMVHERVRFRFRRGQTPHLVVEVAPLPEVST